MMSKEEMDLAVERLKAASVPANPEPENVPDENQEEKPPRVPFAMLSNIICHKLEHSHDGADLMPMFPSLGEKAMVIRYQGVSDIRVPAVIDKFGQVHEIDIDRVCSMIKRWRTGPLALAYPEDDVKLLYSGLNAMSAAKIKEACQEWVDTGSFIDDDKIPIIGFAGEDGLCRRRIPFDLPKSTGEMSLWEEIITRLSPESVDAVLCFIGSIFVPKADRQQYLWIYGAGGDGKSTILRMLKRALGDYMQFEDISVDNRGNIAVDKHWTASMANKRLIAFSDCGAAGFPRHPVFKALTGGDTIRVEKKYENARNIECQCKVIFTSNERPEIGSSRADLRRAIVAEISPFDGTPQPDYEDRLYEQFPSFLALCIETYSKRAINGVGIIPFDLTMELTQSLAEENEMVLENLADELFIFGEDHKCNALDFTKKIESIDIGIQTKKRFKEYLRLTRGVRYMAVWIDGKTTKGYRGLKIRE